jgi:hypothetical protein
VRVEVPPELEQTCRRMCDRSVQLKCGNAAKCLPNCFAMASATPCTKEMLAMYQCLVGQPLDNWECAPDGVAAIKKGLCYEQQAAAVACMEAKMQ